ncbi:hypothetical protein ABEB36_008394 [Hypothenemus hampei]|uniref:Transmembrane protein n=1 Tax=Hypothenemus hampei TaxID=57062 RepID=A0ABD1ELQ9_HYPHA
MKQWFSQKGKNSNDLLSHWQREFKEKMGKIPDFPSNLPNKLSGSKSFNPKFFNDFFIKLVKDIGSSFNSNGNQQQPYRPMKYPYTLTAKIVQFPYKFYFQNNWVYRYYVYAVVACFPVFWYITVLSNSKNNNAKWKDIRYKEIEHAQQKFEFA